MSLSTEALFTAALGLQAPWRVERAELNTAKRRIDFDVIYTERRMTCPQLRRGGPRHPRTRAPILAPPGLLPVRSLAACRHSSGELHGLRQDQPSAGALGA